MNDTATPQVSDGKNIKFTDVTVGGQLDARIKAARQEVERLCILKAKAEATGILEFPQEFILGLAW